MPSAFCSPTKGAMKFSASGKSGDQPRPKAGYSPFWYPATYVFQGRLLRVTLNRPEASSCRLSSLNSSAVSEP
ncbi:hypothetical protein STENM327S_03580 [Streptomyces tendae]